MSIFIPLEDDGDVCFINASKKLNALSYIIHEEERHQILTSDTLESNLWCFERRKLRQ